MSMESPPLKTHQFYHACKKNLGMTAVQNIFSRGHTQINRWCRDPNKWSDGERNPLDRHITLFNALDEIGEKGFAMSALNMLAVPIGCEVRCIGSIKPDRPTVEGECLDDYPAVARFHEAIQNGEPIEKIRHFWQAAKRELDETYEMANRREE